MMFSGFMRLFGIYFAPLLLLHLWWIAHTVWAAGESVKVSVEGGSLSDLSNYKEGDNLTLRCEVNLWRSIDVSICWQHETGVVSCNGALINTNPRFSVDTIHRGDGFKHTLHFLTIHSLKPEDTGNYTCSLADPQSNTVVASDRVKLSVAYFPAEPSPVCDPDGPAEVYIGETLLLKCSTDKGNPEVNLTLGLNTGTFETGASQSDTASRHTIQHSYTVSEELVVDKVTALSNGSVFVCMVSSRRFPNATRSCRLGPLIVIQPVTTPRIADNTPPGISSHPGSPKAIELLPTPQADPVFRSRLTAFLIAVMIGALLLIIFSVFMAVKCSSAPFCSSSDQDHAERDEPDVEMIHYSFDRGDAQDGHSNS